MHFNESTTCTHYLHRFVTYWYITKMQT